MNRPYYRCPKGGLMSTIFRDVSYLLIRTGFLYTTFPADLTTSK
jgi:hypothetical protein